jgi:hypothetical protein
MFRTLMCVVLTLAVALIAIPSAQSAMNPDGVTMQAKKQVWKVHHHGKNPKQKSSKVFYSQQSTQKVAQNQANLLQAAGYVFVEILSLFISAEKTSDVVSLQAKKQVYRVYHWGNGKVKAAKKVLHSSEAIRKLNAL